MATLSANTNYSALSLSNGETIELAGFQLTIDAQPTETGIVVQTPGTAGKVVISGAYDLSTWSFTAGTVTLIDTVPADCVIGSLTAGSASSARGCSNNYGTLTSCTGGSGGSSYGCFANYGTLTLCTGGSGLYSWGCHTNYTTIISCAGGSVQYSYGCNNNYGTLTSCTGGSFSSANGCYINYGQVLKASDGVASAVYLFRGGVKFVVGTDFHSTIISDTNYESLHTLYTIGPLAGDAIIPIGVNIIELSEGSAGLPVLTLS